jgi:hypothetical protein
MDRLYIVEAREIPCIESQDALYAVDMHGGNETGIVDMGAGDTVVNDQLAPFQVNREGVVE